MLTEAVWKALREGAVMLKWWTNHEWHVAFNRHAISRDPKKRIAGSLEKSNYTR